MVSGFFCAGSTRVFGTLIMIRLYMFTRCVKALGQGGLFLGGPCFFLAFLELLSKVLDLPDALTLRRQHRVDLRHDCRTFAHRRRHAFGRARASIADREYAGHAGLERQGGAAGRAAIRKTAAGQDEALVIGRNAIHEPAGIGIGAYE